jgi:hypothetical protein
MNTQPTPIQFNIDTNKTVAYISYDDPARYAYRVNEHESGSLGNIANIASTVYLSRKVENDQLLRQCAKELAMPSDPNKTRRERYKLQSLAAKLLPEEKVAQCNRAIAPNQDHVKIMSNGKSAFYQNLVQCSRVWTCPHCAARITEKRRAELASFIYTVPYRRVLVTYTLRHSITDKLDRVFNGLKSAYRHFKAGRNFQAIKDDYGWVGSIRSYEFTHGANGWHPHIHELALVRADITDEQLAQLDFDLHKMWLNSLGVKGFDANWEHGLNVKTDSDDIDLYVAKYGHEPKDSWSVSREVTKATAKNARQDGRTPFALLEDYGRGDRQAGALFVEYANATKDSHQLEYSKGLRDLLKLGDEKTDEEIIESPEPAESDTPTIEVIEPECLITLSRESWKIICEEDLRAELLEIAASNEFDKVRMWLMMYDVCIYKVDELLELANID